MRCQVIEFRYLNTADPIDPVLFDDGSAWSRVYEYPLALRFLKQFHGACGPRVHNTSCGGFFRIHVAFKSVLDHCFDVVHSDLQPCFPDVIAYDITRDEPTLHDAFDVVLSISTLEEVAFDPVAILNNLLAQTRVGGFVFVTFDVPGLDLPRVEGHFGQSIAEHGTRISGHESVVPNAMFGGLNCGMLVLRRTE